MGSNGCTFAISLDKKKSCSKISSTRQFDHDCAKKTDTKGITSGYYVVLIGNSQELGLKLNTVQSFYYY